MPEVNSDLVRPPGQRLAPEQRPSGKSLSDLKARTSAFAPFRVDAEFADAHGMRGQCRIDFKSVLAWRAAHQGYISLERFLAAKKVRERHQHGLSPGQKHHPAGLKIQPVRIHQV